MEVSVKISQLAFVGFGNVGQGLVRLLKDRGQALAERNGIEFRVCAVCDNILGSVYRPQGWTAEELLLAAAQGDLASLPAEKTGWSAETMIEKSGADTLVEVSYTDLKTAEPALGYIQQALEIGMHVVMTNKGPIALAYSEISELANNHGVEVGVEGTVMSGTPVLALGRQLLDSAGIHKVQGILNGTTNYILTEMEKGISYKDALAQAQQLGYAEADPSGDVEGYDAAAKVVILANLLMGAALTMSNVDRMGITEITLEDIKQAQAAEQRWKLIGTVEDNPAGVKASVKPVRLPMAHPLASVGGATNGVTFSTELLGDVTITGPGAGRTETGYALLNDLLRIHGKISG